MRTLLYPLIALGLFGADWPQFRGPNGSGLCPSCRQLPTEFGPQKNVVWKTELPVGKSSPVLVGDRIFLTASEGDDLITMCLSRATGKVLWRRSVRAARREAQHTLNHRAAPTAATDGKSVFVFFADFGLLAYDFEGKPRWQLPLGPFNSQHGLVASPVYADGRVILVCDQDTDAYIIAVDADSGKIVWKTPRDVINGTPPRSFTVRLAAPHKSSHPAPTSSPRIPSWTANRSGSFGVSPASQNRRQQLPAILSTSTVGLPGTTRESRSNCPPSPR